MKKMLGVSQRKVGKALLKSLLNIKAQKTKSIEEYRDGERVNTYSRRTIVGTVDTAVPYLFALNKAIDSAENAVIYKYNSRKCMIWKATISKWISIMDSSEYMATLYKLYMVKVLDMTKEGNKLVLQGIKIGAAFNQICHEYGVYLIDEKEKEDSSAKESKSHQNSANLDNSKPKAKVGVRAGNYALDICIANKDDWMCGYKRSLGDCKCLCLPLTLHKTPTTQGQVFIKVAALKETASVKSIQEFEDGVDSYIDSESILLKEYGLAELAIMYDTV